MDEKQKTILYTGITLALILAAINIYIFTQPQSKYNKACYKDLCIHSKQKPTQHLETLIQQNNQTQLIFEQDIDETEGNSLIIKSMSNIAFTLTNHEINLSQIHQIGYQDGEPKTCAQINATEKASIKNKTLQQCMNIKNTDKLLIHLKYPNYEENKVIVENNTITVKAKTPQHLLGTVNYLTDKFFN